MNSRQQFADSPDFDEAMQIAVADNLGAHTTMADYFYSDSPGKAQLLVDFADWYYRIANEGPRRAKPR